MITPNCIKAWFDKYYIEFSKWKWKYIFTLTKLITCHTKLREFQFKIIHRVYATNSYVSNFDNSVHKICQSCDVDDNIVHLFVDCKKVRKFWIEFKELITTSLQKPFSLSTQEIIFGKFGAMDLTPNYCILHAKWYIHMNKDKLEISFNGFKKYLKSVLIVEKQIYINRRRLAEFSKLFNPILRSLE